MRMSRERIVAHQRGQLFFALVVIGGSIISSGLSSVFARRLGMIEGMKVLFSSRRDIFLEE